MDRLNLRINTPNHVNKKNKVTIISIDTYQMRHLFFLFDMFIHLFPNLK